MTCRTSYRVSLSSATFSRMAKGFFRASTLPSSWWYPIVRCTEVLLCLREERNEPISASRMMQQRDAVVSQRNVMMYSQVWHSPSSTGRPGRSHSQSSPQGP